MFDVIRKREVFSWLESGIGDPSNHSLKGIQDAFILSLLGDRSGLQIAEIGGGHSRVLQQLKTKNACWNIDKFEGVGCGPTKPKRDRGIRLVREYIGDFSTNVPANYFDVVFSVSVVEHVQSDALQPFFSDCHRILKSGGLMVHAIDAYIFDEPLQELSGSYEKRLSLRIGLYRAGVEGAGFRWIEPPAVDKSCVFKCDFASNSDSTMHRWNKVAPQLRHVREVAQSISLKLQALKL